MPRPPLWVDDGRRLCEIRLRPARAPRRLCGQTTREGGVRMSHVRGTGHRGLTAAAIAALLLGGVASAHAALTTESCLAKKLKEWGKLRNCQAKENGKALQKIGGPGERPGEVRR